MTKINVAGQSYEVADHPEIAVGVPMNEGHVRALQGLLAATLRNRFTQNLKGKENVNAEQVQADINTAAAAFQFGVSMRGKGGGRAPADPVEREALNIAKNTIAMAYHARFGSKIAGEALTTAANELLEKRGDEYRKRAREALRERARAGADVLDSLGLAPAETAQAA